MLAKSMLRGRNGSRLFGKRGTMFFGNYNGNGGPYAQYKWYGTFTGTALSALSAYVPEKGASGTQVSGTWIINSLGAKAVMTDNTDGRLFVFDAAGANEGTIVGSINSDDWTMRFPGLVFRYTSSNDHWLVHLQTNVIIIFECIGGAYTSRATSGVGAPVNALDYPTTITLSGTSITCAIVSLGMSANYTSSANQSSTKFGFRYGAASPNPSSNTFYDNLSAR